MAEYFQDTEITRSDLDIKDPDKLRVISWNKDFVPNCKHLTLEELDPQCEGEDIYTGPARTKCFMCKILKANCNYKNCPAR